MLSFCGHFPQKEFRYEYFSFPVTAAQQQRDLYWAHWWGWPAPPSTSRRPRTPTVCLPPGCGMAAKPEADTTALERMRNIVETEKHRVAPNCATCTMRCGNTDNYDLARLWNAPGRSPHPEARTSGSTFRAGTAPQHPADRRRNSERPICPRRGLGCNPAVPHRFAAQELCRG